MTPPPEQAALPLGGPAEALPAPGSELPGLTGIVPVLDEEQNLEACIASFAEICDELGLEGEDAQWLKDLLDEDDRAL